MTAVHRDRLVLASYAPPPEIQPLESRGEIVSGDLPLPTDGRTPHNYNLNNNDSCSVWVGYSTMRGRRAHLIRTPMIYVIGMTQLLL